MLIFSALAIGFVGYLAYAALTARSASASFESAESGRIPVFARHIATEGQSGGIWKRGTLIWSRDGSLSFAPRALRGSDVDDLTGLVAISERPASLFDRIWFFHGTIVVTQSPAIGQVELGFVNGTWRQLAQRMLARSS